MKNTIISILVVIIIALGGYFLLNSSKKDVPTPDNQNTISTTTPENIAKNKDIETIGNSVQGRDIVAYHYFGGGAVGSTTKEILFVGGIHGGYEWNTALVAYETMNYFKVNPDAVPQNLRVTVIPVLNPDGLNKVVGTTTANFTSANVSTSEDTIIAGRFNGNNVDLNRNFDCDWQSSGKWQNTDVDGGSAAFSEPESQAIKNYIETYKPSAVVVWFSAAGGVYASNCHNGVSSETNALTKKFAEASGYPSYQSFDFYAITGDMTNWLAKINIPAISILLTNHTDTEWAKNLAGIKAILTYYEK